MSGNTINWNAARVKQLEDAFKAAVAKPHKPMDTFRVDLEGRKEPECFVISYAYHLIRYLQNEFAATAPQAYPPNREGKEGE